jgi:hypothetical protein
MYYFEMMSTFLFLLLIGAFFSPIMGGCFAIFLMFFILSGMVVFLSVNFVWIMAIGVSIYAIGSIMKLWRWYKLSDVNQYLHDHPECNLAVGVSCHSCGSDKLTNHGLFHNSSKWRFYVCSHCGTTLFRFNVL